MMKLYFLIVLVVFLIIAFFGFILPSLISESNDIAVISGVILLVLIIPAVYLLIKSILNQIKKGEKK